MKVVESLGFQGFFIIQLQNIKTGKIRMIETKNIIVDEGLRWHRGHTLGDLYYASHLGEIALGTDPTPPSPTDMDLFAELDPLSLIYTYTRKTMALLAGIEPGETIGDVFWDDTEVNDVAIHEIGAWTIIDAGSPPPATPILYARTIIPGGFTKTNQESMTITRKEFLRRV